MSKRKVIQPLAPRRRKVAQPKVQPTWLVVSPLLTTRTVFALVGLGEIFSIIPGGPVLVKTGTINYQNGKGNTFRTSGNAVVYVEGREARSPK